MTRTLTLLINSLEGGGAERVIVQVADALVRDKGWAVHLVLLDDRPERYRPHASVTVERLAGRQSLKSALSNLTGYLRRSRPRTVVSFLTRSNVCNVLTARLFGHVAVISERANTSGHHARGLKGRVANLLVKLVYRRASWVVVPSDGVGLDLIRNYQIPPERIVRIYNPVDRPAILARAEEPGVVDEESDYYLAVGRLVPSKNFEMLIRAYALSGTSRRLLILGEGPLRAALEVLAAELGVADRVRFVGFAANPYAFMRHCRAYLASSNAEGFPNSLAEASALETPIVATNCLSGPSEILDETAELAIDDVYEGKYGVLIPTNDASAMARAIGMLEDDTYRAALVRKVAAGADRFSVADCVDGFAHLVERIEDRK